MLGDVLFVAEWTWLQSAGERGCSSWVQQEFGGTAPSLPSVGATSLPQKKGIPLHWSEYFESSDGVTVDKQDFLSSQVPLKRYQANRGTKWGTTPFVGAFLPFHGKSYFLGSWPRTRVFQQGSPVFSVILHPDLSTAEMLPSLAPSHLRSSDQDHVTSPSLCGWATISKHLVFACSLSPKTFPTEQA